MALHDEPDHICFCRCGFSSTATSSRQSLGRWDSQTFTTQFTALPSGVTKVFHSKNSSPPGVLLSATMLALGSPDVLFQPPCDVCSSQQLPPLHPLRAVRAGCSSCCLDDSDSWWRISNRASCARSVSRSRKSSCADSSSSRALSTSSSLCASLATVSPCPRQLSLGRFPSAVTRDLHSHFRLNPKEFSERCLNKSSFLQRTSSEVSKFLRATSLSRWSSAACPSSRRAISAS